MRCVDRQSPAVITHQLRCERQSRRPLLRVSAWRAGGQPDMRMRSVQRRCLPSVCNQDGTSSSTTRLEACPPGDAPSCSLGRSSDCCWLWRCGSSCRLAAQAGGLLGCALEPAARLGWPCRSPLAAPPMLLLRRSWQTVLPCVSRLCLAQEVALRDAERCALGTCRRLACCIAPSQSAPRRETLAARVERSASRPSAVGNTMLRSRFATLCGTGTHAHPGP
jgi:hypothetical protein